jgi:DNA adenine methylase
MKTKVKSLKSYKTPLRYPGGKSRALSKLFQFIPDLKDYTEFREPFLGGGSVAIEIGKRYPHIDIWVNDLYEPLYNFWKVLQSDGQKLRDILIQLKQRHSDPSSAKQLFLDAKDYLAKPVGNSIDRAVSFYVVNKCSFSGLTESSAFSKQASESNFSINGIDKLPEYSLMIKKWKITNLSYEQMLSDQEGTFIYLDPPYEIKSNLYGRKGDMHKGFNHDEFATTCDKSTSPILISYNSSQLIRDRFEDWIVAEFAHTYTMRSTGCYNKEQASRKELVLMNYEV